MTRELNDNEYKTYLKMLIDSIFQILPLFEEENEYLTEYVESLVEYERKGAQALKNVSIEEWYLIAVPTLSSIHRKLYNKEKVLHEEIRREVLKLTNLISRRLEEIEK